ncbi:SNARE associated Golgi protein [Clavibacter michiganensis subsp. michiganensis]|uniref:SNARE associated Golgi protein n=1 Tax=Clavibacter michiganensis subsp. michiganensis TaxID=33013 RepID=A0A251XFL8_CLAMM|nr:SNARE associated Golgi protein [Clavibacter michiganensis subsp. michiganensis]OUE01231.1 SNARE associated Golgi protein [Clavibacter michiganensis subsp. michiganensis]
MAMDASESSAWPTTVRGASGAAVTGRRIPSASCWVVQAPRPTARPTTARRETEVRMDRGRGIEDGTRPRYATPGGAGGHGGGVPEGAAASSGRRGASARRRRRDPTRAARYRVRVTALLPPTLLPTTIAGARPAATGADPLQGLDGLVGAAARVIEALGEVGVGAMTFVETVFPPIPSEVVLPLAGFVAATGRMNLVLVIVASTLGAYLGALLLYWLGRRAGEERTIACSRSCRSWSVTTSRSRLPGSTATAARRCSSAVSCRRPQPDLPACRCRRMPIGQFSFYTIAGSGLWNGALIGLGAALGSQYELIDAYAHYLDYAVYAVLGILLLVLVGRAVRRRAQRGRGSSDR